MSDETVRLGNEKIRHREETEMDPRPKRVAKILGMFGRCKYESVTEH